MLRFSFRKITSATVGVEGSVTGWEPQVIVQARND